MICRRCLRAGLSLRGRPSVSTRNLSTTTKSDTPEASASPSEAKTQSFSTPLSPPGISLSKHQASSKSKTSALPTSIAPAGTKLAGLNYLKNQDDPIAMEESEYPAWLWHVLDVKAKTEGGMDDVGGDEFSKSKKQRRVAAKAHRRLEARLLASGEIESLEPKVPINHQTIDLPSNEAGTVDGALEAVEAREELRSAMRNERRRKIKEDNYLKGMK